MPNSRIAEAHFRIFTSPLFRYHFGSPLGSGPANHWTKIVVCPPLPRKGNHVNMTTGSFA